MGIAQSVTVNLLSNIHFIVLVATINCVCANEYNDMQLDSFLVIVPVSIFQANIVSGEKLRHNCL